MGVGAGVDEWSWLGAGGRVDGGAWSSVETVGRVGLHDTGESVLVVLCCALCLVVLLAHQTCVNPVLNICRFFAALFCVVWSLQLCLSNVLRSSGRCGVLEGDAHGCEWLY